MAEGIGSAGLSSSGGCAAASLLTGRKTFRTWMFFGAATLAALCLY